MKVPEHLPNKPIIFFDGVCGLCNGFVDFVMVRDKRQKFVFTTLQGQTAETIMQSGPEAGSFMNQKMKSVLLLDGETWYHKSDAALKVLIGLGGFWKLFYPFGFLPKIIRDAVYDLIARNRYKWFGKHETCRMPTPEERKRFLP